MNIPKVEFKKINLEIILPQILGLPIVKVDRKKFLTNNFRAHYPQETIDKIINYSPAYAGISKEFIGQKAKQVINYETNKVTAISTLAGIPGGLAMIGTVSADITQYFIFILRVLQKLAYLYSFPEFELKESDIPETTLNEILLLLGVMFGANGARKGIQALAATYAKHIGKQIPKMALTKTGWYPIAKNVLKHIGYKITKDSVGKTASKAVPIVGGVVSGVLSYATFKPSCYRLKKELEQLDLCDPDSDIYKEKRDISEN